MERYVGLDFSPAAIAKAETLRRGRFVVGDARAPEIYREVEHEAVVCTEVLEHIQDDLLVVSRFGAGKRCLCSVPNFPYESHVRHFRHAGEVKERYGPYFGDCDVMTFKSPISDTANIEEYEYFLLDGVRNGELHVP
ncbi:MAG: class I SAM-dependent methyltransferase [Singulisphaera sp.]